MRKQNLQAQLMRRAGGPKLTGRQLSFEVFPFSYAEYLTFTGKDRGADSLRAYRDDGGFPAFLSERRDLIVQELLRDVVQR